MKLVHVLSISALLFSGDLFSQGAVFSKTAQQYNRLTGATRVMKDSVWDDPEDWKPSERNIPLGFNFQAFNKSIGTFEWGDGAIEFRQVDTIIKIGLEVDFCDYGFGTLNAKSALYRKTEGAAGNRIVKLEWRKAGFWDQWSLDGNCIDSADLQIWIYENPAKVELRFGPRYVPKFSSIFKSKLGVTCAKYDGTGGTTGIILDGDPINPTTYSFGDTGTRGLTSWPVANQVYIFDFSLANTSEFNASNSKVWCAGNVVYTTNLNAQQVQVRSMDGRLVSEGKVEDNRYHPVKELTPGIYIVSFPNTSMSPAKLFIGE